MLRMRGFALPACRMEASSWGWIRAGSVADWAKANVEKMRKRKERACFIGVPVN
jgi:hypothetical protein